MTTPKTIEGNIMVRGKGTGFLSIPDEEQDVVITSEHLGCALDGDLVEITIKGRSTDGRLEGAVTRVIEAKRSELIGNIAKTDGVYRLEPDSKRIHIRPILPDATHTHEGMKVAVELDDWNDPKETPTATIIDILGPIGNHETEMQAIIRSGGFAHDFPEQVQKAAEGLYERRDEIFREAEADPKRRDMRDVTTMTIDPKDAKDFDDAISFQKLENGTYEIGIHIADVSHYVTEGDAIDVEARERGTSVYLVDRVIPMLPEVLSNDLCSLRPDEDRLAFSAVFTLDSDATIQKEWYGQTLIHSDKRFSYEDAQTVLDDGAGEYHTELSDIMTLARLLRKRRYKAGAIAFEQPEVRFELDENGVPIRAYTKHRTETMMMIEDFMLLANRSVAEHVHTHTKKSGRDAAFVYRIHDLPDPEKIEELSTFIHALGYNLPTKKGIVRAKDINALMEAVEGTPEEGLIKVAAIRSMAKAIYSTKNIGHFGLAFKYYTHFTSPIRRYPDLMAHRMLRRHLDNAPISPKELVRYERLATQSSEREMSAVRAERDSIKFKQVEFMADKVGQEFDGVITGVTDWGIYVEEKDSRSEGMIRLSSLDGDFYEHQSSKYRVRGNKTGTTYALGDEIRIKLTRADIDNRELDFALVTKSKK